MLLYSCATPSWFQSFPTIGARCPSTSDLVMVPSTSDTTTFEFHSHRYACACTSCRPHTRVEKENAMTFFPGRRPRRATCSLGSVTLLRIFFRPRTPAPRDVRASVRGDVTSSSPSTVPSATPRAR